MDEVNWAGNLTYGASRLHQPRSVAEVQEIVRGANKVRGLGSRHSFNTIADTDADLVSMRHLNRVISIDETARTVTVEGGITYGELSPHLHAAGYALANLASLPHISIAGATMTATHGSGVGNGNLATAIAGIEFVTASGDIASFRRGEAGFEGAAVSLGALGLATAITLDIVPTFEVRQDLYLGLPFATVAERFDEIMSSAYSVSLFTDWQGEQIKQLWLKTRADVPFSFGDEAFGAQRATIAMHPFSAMEAKNCTEQLGAAGPWHLRLPHFRLELMPSAGEEIQSEYFVARGDAVAALEALHAMQDEIAPLLFASEVRSIAADELWMSTAHGQDSVAFHFTFKRDAAAVNALLPKMESALAPFSPRPHWGKVFTLPAEQVRAHYARLDDFRQLLGRHDPDGKFRNGFIDTYIFG